MFFQKVDSSKSGQFNLYKVFGFWVLLGMMPNGDVKLAVTKPQTVFGNIHRWATGQWTEQVEAWAGKLTSIELRVQLAHMQKFVELARHYVRVGLVSEFVGRQTISEFNASITAMENVLKKHITGEFAAA